MGRGDVGAAIDGYPESEAQSSADRLKVGCARQREIHSRRSARQSGKGAHAERVGKLGFDPRAFGSCRVFDAAEKEAIIEKLTTPWSASRAKMRTVT